MKAPADWRQQIRQLSLLSSEMLELAQAGEWEAVSSAEEKRRVLLEELLLAPLPAELTPLLQDAIQATLTSDSRLQELARVEREKLSDNLKTLNRGRRALQAYRHP